MNAGRVDVDEQSEIDEDGFRLTGNGPGRLFISFQDMDGKDRKLKALLLTPVY
jgi:hypothetical protein